MDFTVQTACPQRQVARPAMASFGADDDHNLRRRRPPSTTPALSPTPSVYDLAGALWVSRGRTAGHPEQDGLFGGLPGFKLLFAGIRYECGSRGDDLLAR